MTLVTRTIHLSPSQQELAEWQAGRLTAHHDSYHARDAPGRRIWNPRSEDTGQYTEMAFAVLYDLPPHLEVTNTNDGRVDFIVNGHRIDVKGANGDYGLCREVAKPHADILVLGRVYLDQLLVRFEGWEFDEEMVKLEPVQMRVMNYRLYANQLKGMDLLEDFLGIQSTVSV